LPELCPHGIAVAVTCRSRIKAIDALFASDAPVMPSAAATGAEHRQTA
jgi:hypothetical protein